MTANIRRVHEPFGHYRAVLLVCTTKLKPNKHCRATLNATLAPSAAPPLVAAHGEPRSISRSGLVRGQISVAKHCTLPSCLGAPTVDLVFQSAFMQRPMSGLTMFTLLGPKAMFALFSGKDRLSSWLL